jgi:hypothetical protein
LWLLKHHVFVKCFRATPFKDGENLFSHRRAGDSAARGGRAYDRYLRKGG